MDQMALNLDGPTDSLNQSIVRAAAATGYVGVPYSPQRETSKAAAVSMVPHVNGIRETVLAAIVASGRDGRTTDEIKHQYNYHHSTVGTRVQELAALGVIYDTGGRRMTRSGRPAIIWRAISGASIQPHEKPQIVTKNEKLRRAIRAAATEIRACSYDQALVILESVLN